ncbi:MAG TPA: bifunctional [glutamine synthetase] adenylyltransferase/[glutamine synthetase]-adenylyl-L-tyrosine phosphorylase [Xanthobacteraceae bacterium]|nr:bifunctional [glutamine synthetase] adenylyltransferase/[glutamine synthetase]-adenylyl-L-tyrosine phosphorylase [Xanthobacteraceae bacterium]
MFRRKNKPAAGNLRSLAERIRKAPRLSAPKAAKKFIAERLAAAEGESALSLRRLFEQKPVRRLVEGVADGSPFLRGLMQDDPSRLAALLDSNPESHFAGLIERRSRAAREAADHETAARELRLMKREAALLIALADIGGVWTVIEAAQFVTALAEASVAAATDFLLAKARAAAQIRLQEPDRPGEGSGFIVLGMGKLGGGELNYSSDIDLIIFFEPKAPLKAGLEPSPFFVRLARDLVRLLQERTPDGYVFRTDLRLRPDPGSTQAAIATDAALAYYERSGQTWERAVFIKARPIAGDIAAGENFLRELAPFVWRRYLDHAAIADVQAMKRQIHAFRGHGEIALEGHNIKLGRGGIREIEFFVQTQQLIAGGRAPELRGKNTLAVLDQLAAGGWIDAKARDELASAYVFLREVEHRLQMVADEQTHTLPQDHEAFARFARFLGFRGRDDFAATLEGHLNRVQAHYSHLFEEAPRTTEAGRLAFPPDRDERETLDALVGMGFRDPLAASATVRRWLSGEYRSLKPETARADLAAILPALLEAFARSGDPNAALVACDRFLMELPGSERLLAALRTHPDLVRLLALILGTAPRLGEIVARSPSLLDGLLDPGFFGASPGEPMLADRLHAFLSEATSEEQLFDRARRFGREQMVLIGVRILSGALSASQAGEAYAALADVVIRALHREVERRFSAFHGRVRGAETAVLALGKLGGREMTAGSDLDLILLYDFDPRFPQSDGVRPLDGSQYFARLTKRLISALTTPTNEGKLYDVDMRLRPSGRSGPVATGLTSFALYQRDSAWTWEHMALTRARVVSAAPLFRARIETLIREVLCLPRDPKKIAADVREMRKLIAADKGESDQWDLKYVKGGLVDIEFIAQYLSLVHAAAHPEILDTNTVRALEAAQSAGVLNVADGELLRVAAKLYHDLTQLLRLCLPGRFDPKAASPALLALLARAGGLPDFPTLEAHLADTQARVRRAFGEVLGEEA